MRRFITVLIVGILSLSTVISGECAEVTGKIGYVDVTEAFSEYEKTKESDKLLKKKEKEARMEEMATEIKRLQNELALSSQKGRQGKQKIIDEKLKKFSELQIDLRRERDKMVREILQEIDKAIEEYARKEGYSIILHNKVLLYGDERADLTDEIVKILNQRYKK